MDATAILKDPETLQYLDNYCRKTFVNQGDADECYLFILNRLHEDDCRRLKNFDGKAKRTTWLRTIFKSQMSDYMRKRFGRRRVPVAIERIGKWAEAVYKLLCWDRRTADEAWVAVSARGLYPNPFEQWLEDVEPVLAQPCPQGVTHFSLDAENSQEPGGEETNPFNLFLDKCDRKRQQKASKVLVEVTKSLDDEERLLLQMAYTEDHNDSSIARVLGLDRRTVKKRRMALLTRFRTELMKEGISGL